MPAAVRDFRFSREQLARIKSTLLSNKRILIRVVAALVVVALIPVGQFGYRTYQISSYLSQADDAIELDDFDLAAAKVREGLQKRPSTQSLIDKNSLITELRASRASFIQGQDWVKRQDFLAAIRAFKSVSERDTKRFEQAKTESAQALQSLVDVTRTQIATLEAANDPTGALAAAEVVLAQDSTNAEFIAIRDRLKPVVQRIEEQRQAEIRAAQDRALALMYKKKDSVTGGVWYRDPSSPRYINRNGFYLLFGGDPSSSPDLWLKIQYYADDWLFIRSYTINVDGTKYDLYPGLLGNEVETDNDYGMIWEWWETRVEPNSEELEIVEAIIKSKRAVIRFNGSQYYDDRTITSTEKRALSNALKAYRALEARS